MTTRDKFISLLEKRASYDHEHAIGANAVDNQEVAAKERTSNQSDARGQLNSLFGRASGVESADSALAKKLFPGDSKKESGFVLMKVAFDAAVPVTKLASSTPAFREATFLSFKRELDKIASWAGAGAEGLHTALDAARKAPQTVGGTAQKFLGKQLKTLNAGAVAAPTKPLAQGSVASKLPTR
jgi:hypothetical protein